MSAVMCDYCGCQQIVTIAERYEEHEAAVTLIGQVQSALTDRRPRDVVTCGGQILAILALDPDQWERIEAVRARVAADQ